MRSFLWNPASARPATENRLNAHFFRPLRPKTVKAPKIGKKQTKTDENIPKIVKNGPFCVIFPRNREFLPRLATLAPFALKKE